ncbi:hypothetical protein BH18ACT7_BH18ACT7_19860 [soil metagenome]
MARSGIFAAVTPAATVSGLRSRSRSRRRFPRRRRSRTSRG